MSRYVELDQFDALMIELNDLPDENARIAAYCDIFLTDSSMRSYPGDPFSDEYYKKVCAVWRRITGRQDYDALENEQSTYLVPPERHYRPTIFDYNSSGFLGRYFSAFGMILTVMDVDSTSSILEYGAGDGQISLTLARLGCSVSVIDIEQRYLDIIQSQCRDLGVMVDTKRAKFGDNFDDNRRYDRILFFEAFHHGLDHRAVMPKLHQMLKPGGKVIFAGEPVIDPTAHWVKAVPFPWGPRLDGLSARAMRIHGWCELGFQQPYFVEMLLRSGFTVQLIPCHHEGLGTCYVATPITDGKLDLGGESLIEQFEGVDTGWHAPEPDGRWTSGQALLPLPGGYRSVRLDLRNLLPTEKVVTIGGGLAPISISFAPAEERSIEVPLGPDYSRLTIHASTHRPSDLAGTADDRDLGIFVGHAVFS